MTKIKFEKLVYPSKRLSFNVIELEDWSLIKISGDDSKVYLQSQLTINMNSLQFNKHIICAHCNVNGKVWGVLRLFHFNNGYAYIIKNDVTEIQISELKKYSIFSKITISEENNFSLFGIVGCKSREILTELFINLPDKNNMLITEKNITILCINVPEERFLLIIPKDHKIIHFLKQKNNFLTTSQQWLSLDIEANFPVVSKKMMNKFVPLSINLEKLKGIDFKKGCYCGQEVIAKMKFRSINKHSLYRLFSVSNSNIPEIGSVVELKKNESWYAIGYVLVSIAMYDGSVWIQAILRNNLDIHSILRVYGDKNSLLYIIN
ncbi:tRNA-modifying protein YgfZ [Buchnera aphidicola (Pemphigus obesinymphae)]|uniref:tRNA-modifying protein YgfZ n=1 Tax=Buchnera aphidicola TaxID=9 RepID=UPI00223812AC|nr:tRNA-modifying protein YgfZ [Buchnera aphidicola]MCW5196348.1 tRNA-modifying protein YgfZ [Buchnera aphidicola (Pemphigus obesinymphae)]